MNFFSPIRDFFWFTVMSAIVLIVSSVKSQHTMKNMNWRSHVDKLTSENPLRTSKAESSPIKMILINGKYYPYNKSNIYEVDGKQMFVIDNGKTRYMEKRGLGGTLTADNEIDPPSEGGKGENMMNTLMKAKKNMKKRNEYLKEVMDQ